MCKVDPSKMFLLVFLLHHTTFIREPYSQVCNYVKYNGFPEPKKTQLHTAKERLVLGKDKSALLRAALDGKSHTVL